MLKVGNIVPSLTLENQHNEPVKLSDFKGKKLVVYFYPKNHTPGCTRQACTFRDHYDEFKSLNVEVIGISKDNIQSHNKFQEDFDLPFLLLSDPELEVAKAFGVLKEKNMFGKKSIGMSRTTFIIDEEGKIIKVFAKADPDNNAQEILEFLS